MAKQLYDESWHDTPCVEAKGWNAAGGYVGIGSKDLAHRVAWTAVHGPIPKGKCILHKCDNRQCVNVGHLFIGTRVDNNRDRDQKGRQVSPKRILSDDDVRAMRLMRESTDMTYAELGKRFGVAARTAAMICRREARAGVL